VAMTCVTLVIFSIYSSLAARLRVREEQGTALSRMLPGGVAERLPGRGSRIGEMERLLVTVLMSDVRGYSGLAEIADPSQLADQVSGHRAAASHAILAEGGTIMQFVGDAVMAVFGAPEPQSNHAERALGASIAMHGAQTQLNQAWAAAGLPAFRLGIGVSTGLVAAAFLGSEERMEYSVVGDPVNLAQRLQELAAGGQTVLSEATYNALTDPPDAERLGPITVKGRQGAVNAFRLHAPPGSGAPTTIGAST